MIRPLNTDAAPGRDECRLAARASRQLQTRPALLMLLAAGMLAACDDDPAMPSAPQTLVLELPGFEPLANDYHYEGWAIIDGDPISTGKFNLNDAGQLVTLDG